MIEVFADITCPFAHVGLHHLTGYAAERGVPDLRFRARAWPLELVNGKRHDGAGEQEKVDALRAEAARELFTGFDPTTFPTTTLPALAAEAAAYRVDDDAGARFSLAVRDALWEAGRDVSDLEVLYELCEALGTPRPTPDDDARVRADHEEGRRRGVQGSPHFFTSRGGFFCPSLDIDRGDDGLTVHFDGAGFRDFLSAATT